MSRKGGGIKTQKNKEDTIFCAFNTGVRSMEYIRGIGNQTRGTLAQAKFNNDFLHPVYSRTENDEDAQLILRDRINYGFFKDMTEEEKISYIRDNDGKEKWMEDIDGLEMRFLSLGEEFLKLHEDDQQTLMSGEFIPIRKVYEMFTKRTGKRTMVFRPSIWILENYNDSTADIECDEYLHLVTGVKTSTRPCNTRVFPIKLKGRMIGFCDNMEANNGEYQSQMNKEFLEVTEWFTPSIYKALLQKCIRVGAQTVKHGSHTFPTLDVTIASFLKLMDNPGSFVPDLQLFVSGGESAFKRLGIILVEDSFISSSNNNQHPENIIETLFGAALCYRHFKTGMNKFTPSSALLEKVFELCRIAVKSRKCYDYNTSNIKLNDDVKLSKRLSICMIEELRSFESDIIMVKDVIKSNFAKVTNGENATYRRPEVMLLSHCLDQHSITDIAHFFFDPNNLEMSIPRKFEVIWGTTGQNPRRRADSFRPDPLVQRAQENLYFAKASKSVKAREQTALLLLPTDITKHRRLDPSWMAGIVGPMESTVNRINTISFINPNNISEIVTIRKPTRDKAANDITTEIQLSVEKIIKTKLSTSWIPINEKLIDANFDTQYVEGKYVCKQSKKKDFDWMDFCNGPYTIKCCQDIGVNGDEDVSDSNTSTCVISHPNLPYEIASSGVMLSGLEKIQTYVDALSSKVLLRIAMYLRPISPTIQLRSISRDGKGTYKDVHWTDSYVFRYLQQLCIWMPSLITSDSTLKFTVHNFPLWQEVRHMIFTKASQCSYMPWRAEFGDIRKLRVHQQEALSCLMDRVANDKRGHLIWMEPGQGKTLIVTSFIGYLIGQNTFPRYCVYTLPKAATATIEAEFVKSKLPYSIFKKGSALRPFCVNIVEHDTLRMIRDELINISTEMFFVIDEMHLLMNDTQRTSVGIEIANLAADFIAMTGTLIKDNDAKNVMQWLEIVSDFPITEKNYMIGIASLISRKLDLGIAANHVLISVPMNSSDKSAYESVVDDKFGGTALRTDIKRAFEICQEVIYHAIIARIREVVHQRRPLFVVAKDTKTQERMLEELRELNCFAINSKESINLPPDLPPHDSRNRLDVIVTTPRHAAGYTLTKCNLLITGVYFGNQATREQLTGRILRMGQLSKQVDIETYHTGLLSYTQKKYENARAVVDSLRGMMKVGELTEEVQVKVSDQEFRGKGSGQEKKMKIHGRENETSKEDSKKRLMHVQASDVNKTKAKRSDSGSLVKDEPSSHSRQSGSNGTEEKEKEVVHLAVKRKSHASDSEDDEQPIKQSRRRFVIEDDEDERRCKE